jgi:hypothetical protein
MLVARFSLLVSAICSFQFSANFPLLGVTTFKKRDTPSHNDRISFHPTFLKLLPRRMLQPIQHDPLSTIYLLISYINFISINSSLFLLRIFESILHLLASLPGRML